MQKKVPTLFKTRLSQFSISQVTGHSRLHVLANTTGFKLFPDLAIFLIFVREGVMKLMFKSGYFLF